MKTTIILIIFFTLFSSTASAELTKQDLEEIRAIVREEVGDLRVELKGDISSTRAELKDVIDSLREDLKGDISFLTWAIGILALAIIAALALPQFLGRPKREESPVVELRELRQRVDKLEAQLGNK